MNKIHRLTIESDGFMLDQVSFRFIAGAIHYFRVPDAYWRDRLTKLKACGFNAVETYVAWNAHEMRRGEFDFSGMLDIERFLRIAQEAGLYAIVRPGPYICSEWEFGGLPWWLLSEDRIHLRCLDDAYLKAMDGFFDELIPRLVPLLSTHGGPILMLQVENEYGSYGDDQEYLAYIAEGLKRRGVDVPLFTSDGPTDFMLTGGTLPGVHKTGNFGSDVKGQFAKLREHQKDGPLMCTEFWNGWFDHWGEAHHSRRPEEAAQVLDDLLAAGASVSAYMFHGGTNFGWMNGANFADEYQPTVSSYDDDAPLNECGDTTKKYELFRDVVKKYAPIKEDAAFPPCRKRRYGEIRFTESADLLGQLDALSKPVALTSPEPMEKLGQGYGLILYRCSVRGPRESLPVVFQDLHDRAHIFADGKLLGIQYRNDKTPAVQLTIPEEGLLLDVLVENMGRVNYGPYLMDRKGVTEGIRLGQTFLYHWTAYPMPLNDLSGVRFTAGVPAFDGRPRLLRAEFEAEEQADTFVKLPGFQKGVIFINGKPLSRYWAIGPQKSAYLPAPFIRAGLNEIVVLELDGYQKPAVLLDSEMELGSCTTN